MPDNSEKITPGDVVVIDCFNLQHKGGKDKPVWVIFLGKDSVFGCPILVYFCRTTSQCKDFEPGGNREGHKFKRFDKGQFGFEEDCLIDYDEPIYSDITKEKFNSYKLTVKGHLPNHILQEIWKAYIKNNRYLNKPQRISIRESFAKYGIDVK